MKLQKVLRVHRNKGIKFQKGAQWFSITDEFARYVISKREWIYRTFHQTFACDEIFLQTLLINSKFRDKNLSKHVRLIDWNRPTNHGASPHTFTLQDLDMITSSPAMFARKFHPSIDAQIIDKIRELYS